MSFAREVERVATRKFEELTGRLAGVDRRRFSEAAYRLGLFRSYQLANPRKAEVWAADVESALLSLESIGAKAAFDARRAVDEAVVEVVGLTLKIGVGLLGA